jgi:hypothetical protein
MADPERYRWPEPGIPPDREFLERRLLPNLAQIGRYMLFVGVADYTDDYPQIVGPGVRFVTTDSRVMTGASGTADFAYDMSDLTAPGKITDALMIEKGDVITHFDTVVLNDVIGFGTNDESQISRMITNSRVLLRKGGVLLLGWNSPEFSEVSISDERMRELVERSGFQITPIDGQAIYTGPVDKPWASQGHAGYKGHRYLRAIKPAVSSAAPGKPRVSDSARIRI